MLSLGLMCLECVLYVSHMFYLCLCVLLRCSNVFLIRLVCFLMFLMCVCGLDTFSYVSSVCMFLRVFPLVSGSFYVFLLCPVCFSYALCVFVTN